MPLRSARLLTVSALALSLGAAAIARAEPARRPASPPAPAPPAPPPAPRPPPRPAVVAVADGLAAGLARSPSALVVTAPLASDAPSPRGAALTALLASQLAGRLGHGARARPEPLALADARAAAGGVTALVYVRVAIEGGKLRATADEYPVPATVWARIRDPEPGPIAHAYAEAPIDAEVRSYLAPIPLSAVNVDRGKNFESDVVALACGDVDGDGNLEIASVSRRRVTTLRLRQGRVAILASRNWPDLAGVSPTPLREPIGFATVVRDRGAPHLDVGLSDRDRSARLDGKLAALASMSGVAIPDGDETACAAPPGAFLTGPLVPCAPGDPMPLASSVGGDVDALASARVLAPDGSASTVWAERDRGVLVVHDDQGHRATVDGAGAQLAVGDLDEDGDPEIIASVDTANPLEDAVVVRTWHRANGQLGEMFRIPAAAGVRALGTCPPDGPGRAPFVVATSDEIWVVR